MKNILILTMLACAACSTTSSQLAVDKFLQVREYLCSPAFDAALAHVPQE